MPYADPEAQREHHRRYYSEHRSEAIARVEAWSLANPGRAQARSKAWREQNPEKMREYQRAWYLKNRDAVIGRVRDRERTLLTDNPEMLRAKRRAVSARRRARQLAATVEPVDFMLVWERDNGICGICGEAADRLDWHLDHIIAVSKGGAHSYANVQVSHPLCNRRKAAS